MIILSPIYEKQNDRAVCNIQYLPLVIQLSAVAILRARGTIMTAVNETRRIFKKMVKLAKSLPVEKQAGTLLNIRAEFRKHRDVRDPIQCVRID